MSDLRLLDADITFDTTMHIRTWGLASIYAHRSYNDTDFLQVAQNVWNHIHKWEITPEDVMKWGQNDSMCSGCEYPALGRGKETSTFYL